MKHPGGRPTKYNVEKVEFVENYVKKSIETYTLPVVQEVAYLLDVDGDTLVEWGKRHKKFSAAIKKLMDAQATMLQQGIFKSTGNVAGGIFLLKNNHGFKDKTETDVTSGGKPIPLLGGKTRVYTDDSNREDTPTS